MIFARKRGALLFAVVISIAIHVLFLFYFAVNEAIAKLKEPDIIELVSFPVKKKIVPKETKISGQIVDLGKEDPNDITPPPDNARFLSERNMRTDKETINKKSGVASAGKVVRNKEMNKPDKKKTSKTKNRKNYKAKNSGVPVLISKKEESNSGKVINKSDLMVSMADLGKSEAQEKGSVDYVPTAVRGDFSSLNARRFAYASFYNRIKKVIRFYWSPGRAVESIGWNGTTLETQLAIVVDADGNLLSVNVLKSCGYPSVDAAAINAIRKASPFYNVPKGLLNEKGELDDIWGFFIQQ